ncbi:MAG: hypothetical protein KDC43_23765 [Saprospiraceae bacterium]|nr:hypothetical protein [Saprospiraceae bacterium]
MIRITLLSRLRLFAALFALLIFCAASNDTSVDREYTITDASKLFLEGTSNVTDFTCNCQESFSPSSFQVQRQAEGRIASFRNTKLKLQSKKLDCGQKAMNKDMYSTLKADEFPYITIELLQAKQPTGLRLGECDDWVPMDVQMAITIAGVRQVQWINVKGLQKGRQDFSFQGSKELLMSSFGLTPPRPLLGLIKVDDAITIHLDLAVKVF